MSDEKQPKKKKGKMKPLILIGGLVLVLGGGGAAAGFYAAGAFGGGEHHEKAVDPNQPVLVPKGEDPEAFATPGHEGEHGEGKLGDESPHDATKFQATYYQVEQPFTSNMADTDAFCQVSIAISTYFDNRVIKNVQTHELAIRSAILMALAEQQETALSTPAGKEKLQALFKGIVNKVLREKAGFGGVDNVYFTNFVIQ